MSGELSSQARDNLCISSYFKHVFLESFITWAWAMMGQMLFERDLQYTTKAENNIK